MNELGHDWVRCDRPAGANPDPGSWAAVAGGADNAVELPAGITVHASIEAAGAAVPVPRVVLLAAPVRPAGDDVPLAVRSAVHELVRSIQRWLADDALRASRLVVLTRGAVLADDPDFTQAVLWGLVRAVQAEHPDRISLVDLDPRRPGGLVKAVALGRPRLAIRDQTGYEPRSLRHEPGADELPAPGDGTMLITGGTSGPGAQVARHAARRGVRNLVLLSRRGGEDEGAAALRDEVTGLGARVTIETGDAADRDRLATVLAAIPADLPLTAVVHAAGVPEDSAIDSLTPERVDTVLRPKIDAAWHLHELTAGLPLSAFVVLSAPAGTLGDTANAFLDPLMRHRRAHGQPGLALGWESLAATDSRELLDRLSTGIGGLMGVEPGGLDVRAPLSTLGMDSVLAMRVQDLVESGFGRALPVTLLLGGASVSDLADYLMTETVAREQNDTTVADVVRLPVTKDVMRLVRAEQQGTPGVTHHIGFALRLIVPTTQERLAAVLTGIADRHAALRTAIVPDDEHGHQFEVRRRPEGALLRWSTVEDEVDIDQRLRELLEPPFDLASAPLWRFEMLETASGHQILLYGAHHAVADASSFARVAAEIGAALSGEEAPAALSNQDIDDLLRAQPVERTGPAAADWSALFAGSHRLDLALTRPVERTFRAATRFVDVPEDLAHQATAQAQRLGITPAALWLGALQVFLARLSGQSRFALAVPVDTRIHVGAADAVGFFGVPIPFPAEVGEGEPVLDVLRRTDTRLTGVLAKGTSFFDTVSVLVEEGLYRPNAPLVEVYFNYLGTQALKLPGLEILPAGTGYSDVDLMVTVLPDLGRLRLDYNLDVLDEESCAGFGDDFLDLLAEVAGDPSAAARPAKGSVAVAATFALGNLPALLSRTLGETGLEVAEAPYHQVLASLLDPAGVFAGPSAVAGVALLRAGDFSRFGPVADELLAELGAQYPAALRSLADRTGRPLIVGFLPDRAADDRTRRWEQDVAAQLRDHPGIAVLAGDDWNRDYRVEDLFDERTESLAHMPFAAEFEAVIALGVTDVLASIRRPPPKVIVVDGDETLWSGVAGEAGPDGVELTGARALLARRLRDWRSAGVLLALVSKNDEATVRAVLDRPDSVLRAGDFSVIAAGWDPKPARIEAVAEELRLGLDSFLFLDDNPVEIAAVRSALPEVLCLTCPPVGELESFIRRLWPAVPRPATAEDAMRADFYRQEKIRTEVRDRTGFADFLERLQLELDVRPLTPATVERSVQLSRRTNQFTLRPAALDAAALARWQRDGEVWTVSARDRFGDYGQVGLLVVRPDGTTLEVVAWMLSCRVLGRGAEERVLRWLADRADALGCASILLTADHTPRNIPARRLVAALGCGPVDEARPAATVTPARLRELRSGDLGSSGVSHG
ncbi:HAD-IIIC family phosphatase [Amycolatopsis sp. NBC_00345]|uniref:HAD-IIIC family phosphatase n=1 Tax=Amycolatopsis sp. NBC_00345 TaxID=2975955 RepID=UPI002E272639